MKEELRVVLNEKVRIESGGLRSLRKFGGYRYEVGQSSGSVPK